MSFQRRSHYYVYQAQTLSAATVNDEVDSVRRYGSSGKEQLIESVRVGSARTQREGQRTHNPKRHSLQADRDRQRLWSGNNTSCGRWSKVLLYMNNHAVLLNLLPNLSERPRKLVARLTGSCKLTTCSDDSTRMCFRSDKIFIRMEIMYSNHEHYMIDTVKR
jgi:hypothetical protein